MENGHDDVARLLASPAHMNLSTSDDAARTGLSRSHVPSSYSLSTSKTLQPPDLFNQPGVSLYTCAFYPLHPPPSIPSHLTEDPHSFLEDCADKSQDDL